jgi:peptidyl-prolyl cis-trans isomerase D
MMRAFAGSGCKTGGFSLYQRNSMLRGIRTASSNWLGRIVMAIMLGAIAVSFAIWGIGDIFKGFGRQTVAKVGATEITVEDFRRIYNDRLQQLGTQIGRRVTPDQARALRLDQQLANQLVADATLDQRARAMRLNLSDAEIARLIMSDPLFKGARGEFDRVRFEQMIRNYGYTEPRYAAEQKRLRLRNELADTINGDLALPKTMEQAFNRYENEQRAVDYVTLDKSRAGDIAPPSPEAISAYYEQHKAQFRAPEYRTVVVLAVTPAELATPDAVSDADVKRYYEANANRFGTPERRALQQIVFPTEEEAKTAAARLNAEFSFDALAKERGMSEKDLDLGTVTKSGLIDQAVADAAFSLKEGEISAPIKGTFGTSLVKVAKIEPEQIRKLEDVTGEIKQTLALDRARTELGSRHDKIEDERGGGARLTEIAQKLGLTARTIAAVDRSGLDPEGKPVGGFPGGLNPIANAFGSDVGVDNEPLQVQGGGYLWYEVLEVKKSRERPLDEVRAGVEERWRNEEISKRLKAKATEIVEKLKGGAALNDVASADGLNVQTTFGVKRSGAPGNVLSGRVVDAMFETAKDAAGMAEGSNPTEWVVFRLTDITVPELVATSGEAKRITDAMRRSISEDIIAQYITRLQADIGASINQTALRQAVSGSNADPN